MTRLALALLFICGARPAGALLPSWDAQVSAIVDKKFSIPEPGFRSFPAGPVFHQGPADVPAVAITFDDGPGASTPGVLEVLARHGVKATFFVVGREVERRPALAARIVQEGHEIANHTYSHANFCSRALRGPGRRDMLKEDIKEGAQAILSATGVKTRLLRMPYGCNRRWIDDLADRLGYTLVLWSVDCRDWSRPGAAELATRALENARAGSVILLHDGGGDRTQTVAALDLILYGLEAKGLRAVPAGELLKPHPKGARPAAR